MHSLRRWRTALVVGAVLGLSGPATSADLPLLSSATYNGPGNGDDRAYGMTLEPNGNVVVVGNEFHSTQGANWAVRRYDPTLTTLLAASAYNGPGNSTDEAYGVAVDSAGNVIVVGFEWGAASNGNWRIQRYDPTLTTILSSTDFSGAGINPDAPAGVVARPNGDVVVAGREEGGAGGPDWRIRRYNATLTALLSTTSWNGPGNNTDEVTAIAAEAGGNLVVVGNEIGTGGSFDWRVRRYDATLTTLLGTTAYNAPANATDVPKAVAVDAAGNIIVAGYEVGSGGNFNWRVRRYNAALTTLLGSTDWNGPGNGDDIPGAVVVLAGGDVVVAGTERGATGFDNWRVRRYDATLTTLLSSTDFNGPGDNLDQATCAVVNASGSLLVAGSAYHTASGMDWQINRYGVPVTASEPDPVAGKLDTGQLIAAPNAYDPSVPGSRVVVTLKGTPGAAAHVDVYDEAGSFIGSIAVALDGVGLGRWTYAGEPVNGRRLGTGVYWAVARDGGVAGRRRFAVVSRRR